ncbi:MAG: LytR C-terminal domain-containing protein [Gemmatimonadota bacterium]|nr:LytR C-terminal domain-containing protein [Gemmatimonadota bacterium]
MRRLIGLAAIVAALSLAGTLWWRANARSDESRPVPGEADGYVVELLNASGVDGLARTMTRQLRAKGIDVVYFGNAALDTLRRTQILVRRGDSTAALRVRAAMGVGTVVIRRDSSLLLDATVYVGRDAAVRLQLDP